MVDRSNLKLNDTIEREIEIWRGTVHGQAVWSMYHNGSSYESICDLMGINYEEFCEEGGRMKRVFIPIGVALKQARDAYGYPKDYGICACYDVENMGWCKDEVTRWYHFTSVDGKPAYTLKR